MSAPEIAPTPSPQPCGERSQPSSFQTLKNRIVRCRRAIIVALARVKRLAETQVNLSRFVEKAIAGVATLAVATAIGVGVSIAGTDPTPAIWWFTGAAISAVIAVFFLDDLKEMHRWKRTAVTLGVGILAMFAVRLGDQWVSGKVVASSLVNLRQIASQSAADARQLHEMQNKRQQQKAIASANPLRFSALVTNIEYTPGTIVNNIPWRPFFTELDFMVTNPTDNNYDDLDIVVRPDFPVAHIAQLSNLPDVSFEDYFGLTQRTTAEDMATRRATALVPLATNAGYKIHCGHIPPNITLRIIMALVDMKKGRALKPGERLTVQGDITTADFSTEETFATKDGIQGTYWFGSADNIGLYGARPNPTRINVTGSYTVVNERLSIKVDVEVPKVKPQISRASIPVAPNNPIHWSQQPIPASSNEWRFQTLLTIQTDQTLENPTFKIVCDTYCAFDRLDMGVNAINGTARQVDGRTVEAGIRQEFTPRTPLTVVLDANSSFRVVKVERIY